MPREICQSDRVVREDIEPLCNSCVSRGKCRDNTAIMIAQHAVKPDERKLFMVTECGEYRPNKETRSFQASLFHRFIKAGVQNLCQGCSVEEMGDCHLRDALTSVTVTAKRNGNSLEATVFCCSTNTDEKLYQISEPSR